MSNLYLDANILLDILLPARSNHKSALKAYLNACERFDVLGTSENILTTIDYIAHKNGTDCHDIIRFFEQISRYMQIHHFASIRDEAVSLYKRRCEKGDTVDFEDLLQLLCAQEHGYTFFWTEDRELLMTDCDLGMVSTRQLLEM